MKPPSYKDSLRQAGDGRLDFEAAKVLYQKADLLTLGQLAQRVRFKLNPDPVVTYAVDRNINYTNVCISKCAFCAFCRDHGHPEAYVMDQAALGRKCDETLNLGGTQILYQGGLNPDLDLEWHLDQVKFIRAKGLHVHGYSPPEIVFMAGQNGITIKEVIDRLMEAGLGSIPGGGAEVLVDRVRQAVSPHKATTTQWLEVMRTAHELGLRTTATMMFGHFETGDERLEHLLRLRRLQDETEGFTAFIPWPYQPGEKTVQVPRAGGTTYLRVLALARLVLDNFAHIQASWVTQGPEVGQVALHFGADDLGSTMIEENVVASAGVSHRLSQKEMVRLIEAAGFEARQRNTFYASVESTIEARA
jgi:cyclic dehypoxanthinyl futalosine synthase